MTLGTKLPLIATLWVTGLHAEVNLVRSYHTREPTDRNVLFAMAVTPDQDVLSFVGKGDGKWRLTRVQNWLDKNPVEQTVEVPGVVVSKPSQDARTVLSLIYPTLLVHPGGRFVAAVATGFRHNREGYGGTTDNIISVVDLQTFRVLTTVHQSGTLEFFLDHSGRLVTQEIASTDGNLRPMLPRESGRTREVDLKTFTLPDLTPFGNCRDHEALVNGTWVSRYQECGDGQPPDRPLFGSTPALNNGNFRLESANNRRQHDVHDNIYSAKTGAQIGTVKETTRDSVNSRLAEHSGRDYLLVMEGGTQLKVYEITESHR